MVRVAPVTRARMERVTESLASRPRPWPTTAQLANRCGLTAATARHVLDLLEWDRRVVGFETTVAGCLTNKWRLRWQR